MSDLSALVARAATFTAYRARHYDADPMVLATNTTATVAEATALVRDHFARRDSLSSITAAPHGAITLAFGTRRTRLEPGIDARPQRLTQRQADDLLIIARSGRATLTQTPRTNGLSIACGLVIPPAATERLIERGYIATTGHDGAPVTVSLAGTVALTWRACKTAQVPAGEWGDQIAEAVHDVYRPEPADA